MAKKKRETSDGVKLVDIARFAEEIGCEVKDGSKHVQKITCYGLIPCALGPTTSFKKHVEPWMKKARPYLTKPEIYQGVGLAYA